MLMYGGKVGFFLRIRLWGTEGHRHKRVGLAFGFQACDGY